MPQDRFWRSVGLVLTGTAAAQAIPLLGSLLIARLYLPSEFGWFATWLGMAALAAVVITGRYEMALPIEPDGAPRRAGVVATLVLAVAGAAVLGAGTLLFVLLRGAADVPAALLWSLAPTALILATAQIWQTWAAAEGRFRDLAVMRIAQAAGITGLQIGVGTFAASVEALALGHAAGALLGLAVSFGRLPLPVTGAVRRIDVVAFWRRHRRFPTWSLPADAVNTAAAQLPLVLIGSRFGAEAAGLLALAMRTLGAPISLLGASVLDVFRRRAAASWRERGSCRADYLQTLRILALGSALVAIAIALLSEPLFAFAFGERWRAAGTVALWLLPMFALRFVASPLSYVFYVAGKQHVDLVWQLGLLAMTLSTLTLAPSAREALLAYGAGYSALYVVYLLLSYRFSRGART